MRLQATDGHPRAGLRPGPTVALGNRPRTTAKGKLDGDADDIPQAFSKRIHWEKDHKEVMDSGKVDTGGVTPSSFPDFQKHIDDSKAQGGGTREIDLTKGHQTRGTQREVIGQIALRLKGKFTVDDKGWKFDGGLEAARPDKYNFDLGNKEKRGSLADFATWIGSQFKGVPYTIEFKGTKPIQEGRTWRNH